MIGSYRKEVFGFGTGRIILFFLITTLLVSFLTYYIIFFQSQELPSSFEIKGKWSGHILIKESLPDRNCVYNGSAQLGLSREDELVYGVFFVENIQVESDFEDSTLSSDCYIPRNPPSLLFEVNGSFSSPSIKLTSKSLILVGHVVSNNSMILKPESCVVNYMNPDCSVTGTGPSEIGLIRFS
jgi:hypothetical protein